MKNLVPIWLCLKSILFPGSFRSPQVEAVPTSSTLDGFKANLVFKEIEKRLEEVSKIYIRCCQEDPGAWGSPEVVQVENLCHIVKNWVYFRFLSVSYGFFVILVRVHFKRCVNLQILVIVYFGVISFWIKRILFRKYCSKE